MFTNILNPFLKTRQQVKNRAGIWVDDKQPTEKQYTYQIAGASLADNGHIVFTTDKKVIIDSFQFSCNTSAFMRPRLHASREFNQNGAYYNNLFVATNHSTQFYDATPAYINSNGHPLLEMTVYDFNQLRFKMMNKVPIILPEGGKLGIYPSSSYDSTQHSFALAVAWREIEVL